CKLLSLEVSGVDVATRGKSRPAPRRRQRAPTPARLDIWVTSATPSTRKIPAPSTEHGTRGVERSSLPPANTILNSGIQLLLGRVPRDQCRTRRKYRGKRQLEITRAAALHRPRRSTSASVRLPYTASCPAT